ncbi:MAG: DUF1214 domain-containing protein [Pseudomonadota bacterium]
MSFTARVIWIACAVASAIAVGAYATEHFTRTFPGFAPLKTGPWTAYPGVATSAADPYARAYLSRTGRLSIADTEGIDFSASDDSDGRPLSPNCNYALFGEIPANRLWTFRVSPNADIRTNAPTQGTVTTSRSHVRVEGSDIHLHVGKKPTGLNWHQISGDESERLRFTFALYDSPVATATGFSELEMPSIKRMECVDG